MNIPTDMRLPGTRDAAPPFQSTLYYAVLKAGHGQNRPWQAADIKYGTPRPTALNINTILEQ